MGLRDRQKAFRADRILQAAAGLFRAQGVDATRMEDIAHLADVSPGTVYNYFPTKGDLLVGIVAHEVAEVVAAGEGVVADPPGDVATAIMALIGCYYDHSLTYLSRDMWRAAMAQTILAPETPAAQGYVAQDAALAAQVTALLQALQRRGRVSGAVDTQALGQVIFHHLDAHFRDFVRGDETLDALKARVGTEVAALARLIAV